MRATMVAAGSIARMGEALLPELIAVATVRHRERLPILGYDVSGAEDARTPRRRIQGRPSPSAMNSTPSASSARRIAAIWLGWAYPPVFAPPQSGLVRIIIVCLCSAAAP
jgi:hypothetical protein